MTDKNELGISASTDPVKAELKTPGKAKAKSTSLRAKPAASKDQDKALLLLYLYNHKLKKSECRILEGPAGLDELCSEIGGGHCIHFTDRLMPEPEVQELAIGLKVQYIGTILSEYKVIKPRPAQWQL